jgi:hypothetical protein
LPLDTSPLVVLANDETVYNRFDPYPSDNRIVSTHASCDPTITAIDCPDPQVGQARTCTIKGGPFIHRQNMKFGALTTNQERFNVFIAQFVYRQDDALWLDESNIKVQGTWLCDASGGIEVAYRHPGIGLPSPAGPPDPQYKVKVQSPPLGFYGQCMSSVPPAFCAGKADGWWCSPNDGARIHCSGNQVDSNGPNAPQPCAGACVSMAAGHDDVCLVDFCAGRTTGTHCLGVEPAVVFCAAGYPVGPASCTNTCVDLPGAFDICQ